MRVVTLHGEATAASCCLRGSAHPASSSLHSDQVIIAKAWRRPAAPLLQPSRPLHFLIHERAKRRIRTSCYQLAHGEVILLPAG